MVKKAESAQNEISFAFDQMLRQVGNLVFDDVPRAARMTMSSWKASVRRATSAPKASYPKIMWSSAGCSAQSMWNVAPRSPGLASTT
jgi:hypothetical protein